VSVLISLVVLVVWWCDSGSQRGSGPPPARDFGAMDATIMIENYISSPSHLMTSAVFLRLAARNSLPRFQPCIPSLRVVNRSHISLLYRQSRHLTSQSTPTFAKPQPPTSNDPVARPKDNAASAGEVTVQEQRRKDWSIIRNMMEHMWPRDWGVRGRVILGLGLLVGGKVNCALNSVVFLLNTMRIPSCSMSKSLPCLKL